MVAANDSVNGTWTYSYDDFNRLVSSACSANCPDGQNTQGFGYVYDRYANRWQQNVTAGSGPQPQATFNGNNNRIDGDSYDADGNLLYDGVHSYTYDAESRIVAVDGGGTATYVYDAEGRRVQKTTAGGTVSYVYDIAGEQVAEVNASGGANREEVYAGGRHVATYTNGTTYFDHADWLGTERMRTMVSGSACETIVSLAFGDGTATTGSCSDASPMHFTGKQHDDESNLDDFDARYYSSQWGRFISADWSAVPAPVPYANLANPQTLNLYAIVADNPDTFADLDGHMSLAQSKQGPTPPFDCSFIGGPALGTCSYQNGALESNVPDIVWASEAIGNSVGQYDPVLEEETAEAAALDASWFSQAQQQNSDQNQQNQNNNQNQQGDQNQNQPIQMSGGKGGQQPKGERRITGKPEFQDKPGKLPKGVRQNPNKPDRYQVKDPHTGNWVDKPKAWSPYAQKVGVGAAVATGAVILGRAIAACFGSGVCELAGAPAGF